MASNVSDASDEQQRRNLILASAFFHTQPPTDRIYANCARVLRHALIAAGMWDESLDEASSAIFTGDEEALAKFPVVERWYSSLIQLTLQETESERLLNGGGNLAAPAGAFFTACWLTPTGRSLADRLLEQNPDWKAKLNDGRKEWSA